VKLDHISYSQMNTLHKCGEQYRRRYIEGEKVPPGVAQIRGSSVHKPIELNLINKMQTGEFLPLEAIGDLAADTVAAKMDGEIRLDGDYAEMGLAAAKGFVQNEVVSLSLLHAKQVAPSMSPKAVEVRIELPPSDAIPVKLVGVLDIVDEHTGVHDTKTAQKSPGKSDADDSGQLTTYDLLHRAHYGEEPKGLSLDVLVRTPSKGDLKVVSLQTKRSVEDLGVYVRRVQAAVRMIESEIFLPAPQDSWQCSTRFCGYAESCPFYNNGRTRPVS